MSESSAGTGGGGGESHHFQGTLFREPSFAELAQCYRSLYLPAQRKFTSRSRESILRGAEAWLSREKISHPRAAEWRRYFIERVDAPLGDPRKLMRTTANQHRKTLAHVYHWCRDLEGEVGWRLLHNPFKAVERFKPAFERPRALASAEVTYPLLLASAPDPMARAYFSVLRRHGLRLEEALGLQPEDVKLDQGKLCIERNRHPQTMQPGPLKSDTSRATMELHPESATLLRAGMTWLREHRAAASGSRNSAARLLYGGQLGATYVFPYFGWQCDELMKVCRAVSPLDFPCRVQGVRGGAAWHVFRHTFASQLVKWLDAGKMPFDLVHDLLRHRNVGTTSSYINSLRGRSVGDDRVRAMWAAEGEAEYRAVRERDGQGLRLVTATTTTEGGDRDA